MNDFLLNLSSEKLNDLNFYISHNLQVFAKLYLIYMTIKWYFGTLCTSKWCSLGFCAIGLLVFKMCNLWSVHSKDMKFGHNH